MNFNEFAKGIIPCIGGASNIAGLTHCATRLRFTLKDESKADEVAVRKIDGVLGVARSGGQFQVIIGNQVPKAFAAINKMYELNQGGHTTDEKKKKIEVLFDFISSVFTPILPAIIGAGLIKSFLALAVLFGMNAESTTYAFVNLIGDAPLYFLPMMIAITASKKLGCNTFMAVAITGALLHPNYTAMVTDAFNLNFTSMFGIPVTLASYNASVIPALLMVLALKYVDAFFDKVIPNLIKFFFKPVLTLLVVACLTFIVLGPIGFILGTLISSGINYISDYAGWLVPTIIGALMPLMITTGMHYGLVPFMLQSIGTVGYEQISNPGNLPSNIAQSAASLAICVKTKKSELKKLSLTTGITALLGITEPALFGVTLKYKKVLASVMIGGAVGGLYAGLTDVKAFSFCSPGLLSFAAFVEPGSWSNLINAGISCIIGFFITFVLVLSWGYKDEESVLETQDTTSISTIKTPVIGKIIPLAEVNDPSFAQEMMGKGFAVIPEDTNISAPIDGEIVSLFPTKHAIGILGENGEELLIHVGINTVELDGKGFETKVKQGDKVRQGDILLQADFNAMKKAGYDITTMVIITNTKDYQSVELTKQGTVSHDDDVLELA